MTTLQFSWAPDTLTYETFGRTAVIIPPPPPDPVFDLVTRVSGSATDTVVIPPTGFVHPGILLGTAQLDYTKSKLGTAPWSTEYNKLLTQTCTLSTSANNGRAWSSLSWTPRPWTEVIRGSSGGGAQGDLDQQADGIAAYTHALLWYYTGNRANALKAIEILNAWNTTLTNIRFTYPAISADSDGLLQSGWTGSMMPRSAEIIRHTFTATGSETPLNVNAAKTCFRNVYLPRVKYGWTGAGANWLMAMAEAHMNIAIFLDDQTEFNLALVNFRNWVKAMMWHVGDVNVWPQLAGYPCSPRIPNPNPYNNNATTYDKSGTTTAQLKSYWYNPTPAIPWPNGMTTETGRDPWHMSMGFAATFDACETARLQGVDLYGEIEARATAAMEYNCRFIHDIYVDGAGWSAGKTPPVGWPYAASTTWATRSTDMQRITWVMAYNHYHNRRGISLPQTAAVIADYVRSTSYRAALMIAWEPLTHDGAP